MIVIKKYNDVWDIPLKVNIPFILENYTTFYFAKRGKKGAE